MLKPSELQALCVSTIFAGLWPLWVKNRGVVPPNTNACIFKSEEIYREIHERALAQNLPSKEE